MDPKFPIWPLRQSIALTHPSKDGVEPIVKLRVEVEKSFLYMEDLGWSWHKSWNIPTITISDPDNHEELLCPNGFKAQLYAVKSSIDVNNKVTLVDVGLQGHNKVDIVESKASFQSLKFTSTSFINDNAKFYLVVCVYLQVAENTRPKILKSMISPSVFVDSRKRVKDNEKSAIRESSAFAYIEPFYPDNFGKRLVKKSAKKKDAPAKEIKNTLEGLYLYLTAPNIRHKIRHPVFLSVDFSACVSLFYNTLKIKDKEKENFVEVLQKMFYKDLADKAASQEPITQDASFIMLVDIEEMANDQIKIRKMLELLNPILCKSFNIVYCEGDVPSHFLQFNDTKQIRELYSKSYPILDANKDLIYEEDFDQDEFLAKIPKPETQTFACSSQEKNAFTEGFWRDYFSLSEREEIIIKKIKEEQSSFGPIRMIEDREFIPDPDILNIVYNHSSNDSGGSFQEPQPQPPTLNQNVNIIKPYYFNQLQNPSNASLNSGLPPIYINNASNSYNYPGPVPMNVPVYNTFNIPNNQFVPIVYASNAPFISQNNQLPQDFSNIMPMQSFIAPQQLHQQQQQQPVIFSTNVPNMQSNYNFGITEQSQLSQYYRNH